MSDQKEWLSKTMTETLILSEAYQLRLLGRLWWANLMFVVLPAVFTAAAAIFAALPESCQPKILWFSTAAWLAGAAAVLMAVHKSLKCEDYQFECLRLSQSYKSIATSFEALLTSPIDHDKLQELNKKLELLTESAKAPLPKLYWEKAEHLVKERQKLLASSSKDGKG